MNTAERTMLVPTILLVATLWWASTSVSIAEQAVPSTPLLTPRDAAQVDLTGYWVSVVTEDWLYRMRTATKGDVGSIPVSRKGWEVAKNWDPEKDAVDGQTCKAYGAAGIMRRPGRLHITWQDEWTLRIDFDTGNQTRLLHFAEFLPPSGIPTSTLPLELIRFKPPTKELSLQGYSVAAWSKVDQAKGFERFGTRGMRPPQPGLNGALVAVTTQMSPGYLQPNGVPYSSNAVLTEYFNRLLLANGDEWLIVTSVVEDSEFLSEPYVTSTHFRREADSAAWNPIACGTSGRATETP